MNTTHKDHQKLNEHGIGSCSVPMWMGMGDAPAGFCNKDAYGVRPESRMYHNYCRGGRLQREDGRYDGYVPALACPCHGGPRSRVFKDGDAYCAVFPDFVNLQESECAFGATVDEARAALSKATGKEAA